MWTGGEEKMADFNKNDMMVEMYLFETSQLLEQLEQVILSSESDHCYSEESVNEIFRIMHTIKGSSAMMKYNNIFTIAHTIEDIFFFIREENPKQNFVTTLNDLILESIDFIKIELEKIMNRCEVNGDATELVDKLKAFLTELKNNINVSINEINDSNINIFKAVIFFEEGCEMENIRAFSIIHKFKEMTLDIFYYPHDITENEESVKIIRDQGFQIYFKTKKTQDEIHDYLMQTAFLSKLELIKIDEDSYIEASSNKIVNDPSSKSLQQNNKLNNYLSDQGNKEKEKLLISDTIKSSVAAGQKQNKGESYAGLVTQSMISVNVAKLDKLMDLVGEMVIAEAMVLQNPDLDGLELDNFHKAASHLSKITSEIQDTVMSIRMVPLSATFQRMNRIVRDMSRKLNKEIHLEIIGEETEVDKNIIEHITDPIMHLVRNAVDHGIEAPAERQLIGKPRIGTITLEAKNAGSDVHIIIMDDGRGLDKDKILERARKNNLLTMNEEDMTESQIYKLILLPGFSTNENVTEFSGRGVGMDVVAKNIESIGGSISIRSKKSKGTQITLKIPLTLAIIDGMNLQVGKSTYTIPTISIRESFRPKKEEIIVDPDGNEMILVRGQCYPILRLHEFFKVKTDITDLCQGIITMVSQDGKTLCIFADKLLGQQQVVVKSLPEYIKRYKKIRGISGCTLLGDGSISLILDIVSLINIR